MGLRGPAPKPSVFERAEGFPGKRKRNTQEPQPAELTVAEVKRRCPKHLKGDERKWWRYYGALLTPLRVITETDLVAMEALARTTTERVAQEEHADLLVIATHGRTGLKHFFLGSVVERVIHHAHCPVLVVR